MYARKPVSGMCATLPNIDLSLWGVEERKSAIYCTEKKSECNATGSLEIVAQEGDFEVNLTLQ